MIRARVRLGLRLGSCFGLGPMGRVFNWTSFHEASCQWNEFPLGYLSMGQVAMGELSWGEVPWGEMSWVELPWGALYIMDINHVTVGGNLDRLQYIYICK